MLRLLTAIGLAVLLVGVAFAFWLYVFACVYNHGPFC